MRTDIYQSPLCERYASKEMQHIFSNDKKFSTWRKLWIALAESEKELGIPITEEQIEEMKQKVNEIDYEKAAKYESELRHDVMAHVHTFGDACPNAAGIIHLGATSCYVGDNTDIILMHEALQHIKNLLLNTVEALSGFAMEHKALPTLAYTHFQAAQPTTVGKRACLWLNDLMFDIEQIDFQLSSMKLLGCKGATGTGASFLELFEGDEKKVELLEQKIAEKIDFPKCQSVSGQTYTRKADFAVLQVLSGIAQSAAKFSNDIRLLSHLKEVDEPFEKKQIGSSAMAYKRNPMRSERIASLARYVMCDLQNTAITASAQWFERTLDDSANKRIAVPEAFLAVDAILNLYINIVRGMKIYPAVMKKHLDEELPFMATENILMYCVKEKGGDRQVLHEAIRRHSVLAAEQVKLYGKENDLLERIRSDESFKLSAEEMDSLLKPEKFTGMAEYQCEKYIMDTVLPLLQENKNRSSVDAQINV